MLPTPNANAHADDRQRDLGDLRRADEVRAQQHRDETREHEVVVAVLARAAHGFGSRGVQTFVLRREMRSA